MITRKTDANILTWLISNAESNNDTITVISAANAPETLSIVAGSFLSLDLKSFMESKNESYKDI